MQYGSADWMINDHDEAIKQLKYAYDKGINVSRFDLCLSRVLLVQPALALLPCLPCRTVCLSPLRRDT